MSEPEIVNFIVAELKAGTGATVIRTRLKKNGWNEADIAEAFALIGFAVPTASSPDVLIGSPISSHPTASSVGQGHLPPKRFFFLTGILALCAVAIVSVLFFRSPSPERVPALFFGELMNTNRLEFDLNLSGQGTYDALPTGNSPAPDPIGTGAGTSRTVGNFSLTLHGATIKSVKTNQTLDLQGVFSGLSSAMSPTDKLSLQFEIRAVESNWYVMFLNTGGLPIANKSALEHLWLKGTATEAASFADRLFPTLGPVVFGLHTPSPSNQSQLLTILARPGIFSMTDEGNETLDGVALFHYTFSIDRTAFHAMLQSLNAGDFIGNEAARLDQFVDGSVLSGDIWIRRGSLAPYRIRAVVALSSAGPRHLIGTATLELSLRPEAGTAPIIAPNGVSVKMLNAIMPQ